MNDDQTAGQLNPLAIEIIERGLRGREPIVPEWMGGIELPLPDMLEVIDYVVSLYLRHRIDLRREAKALRQFWASIADSEGLIRLPTS
jgi:hypothetical protein